MSENASERPKCPSGKSRKSNQSPENRAKRAALLSEQLLRLYPHAACSLDFRGDPFRLLVMARLSAQCTDVRVNAVCETLFAVCPDVTALAALPTEELEELIRPCGLFRSKAKSLHEMSQQLLEKFDGQVPLGIDELLSLSGVGRKIANLIRGDYFGLGGIVADTHCIRLATRFGLSDRADPKLVEQSLTPLIQIEEQSDFCHRMVEFGRDRCKAQNPRCATCPLRDVKIENGEFLCIENARKNAP